MKKHKITWVLVADGTRARIFVKEFKSLSNALGQDFVSDNLRDSEIYMDKPGRSYDSSNPTRHAYQPRTDWHEYQKRLFAKDLCTILDKANENADFDELIIISPPKMLGDIRSYLAKQILSKVTAEIPKDISKLSEYDLLNYLEQEV
ncbi:MAG: host attachment protein [Alphaproteobacteria bacterium]|nr:host attachment protein [Alphaproteobacteria bacterium]